MGEEVRLELGKVNRPLVRRKKSPLEDGRYVVASCGLPMGVRPTPVFVSTQVLQAIKLHALADPEHEVGGVLVGEFCKSRGGFFVEVTEVIRAEFAESSDVSLTFRHETWKYIHEELSRRTPPKRIVGWYHSHPGLGVSLSREDEFIHQNYFSEQYHIAIVFDPQVSEWAVYGWLDGALNRVSSFYVFTERGSTDELNRLVEELTSHNTALSCTAKALSVPGFKSPARSTWVMLWVLMALLVMSQVVIGLTIFRSLRQKHTGSYFNTAIEFLNIGNLSEAARLLQLEISDNPGNHRALQELRRVCTLLSDPAIGGTDGEHMDRINSLLAAADNAVRLAPGVPETSILQDIEESLSSDSHTRPMSSSVAPDYFKLALDIYRWASPTRQARLQRAIRVRERLESLLPSRTLGGYSAKRTWAERAVRWLSEERMREIAYGMLCGDEKYDRLFKDLSSSERETVKRIYADLSNSAAGKASKNSSKK